MGLPVAEEKAAPSSSQIPPLVTENWVACDICEKWRLLPYHDWDPSTTFYCEMMDWLPEMNNCELPEDESTVAVYKILGLQNPAALPAAALPASTAPVTLQPPQMRTENWVACDICEKFRLLPYDNSDPSRTFHCEMMDWLPGMNACEISEDETTEAVYKLLGLEFHASLSTAALPASTASSSNSRVG